MAGKAAIGVASGNGSHTGRQTEGIKRSVRISDAAKFDKIYKFLQSNEDDGTKYYEFLSESDYNSLHRDDFLEVLVTARFSKMKELTDSVKKIAELAAVFLLIHRNGQNNKSRAFNNISKLSGIIHILRHCSSLRSIERHLLDVIKDFIQFYVLPFGDFSYHLA